MATKLPNDLSFSRFEGETRDLSAWLTTFHLASVVLDPYTNESSWVLKSAVRALEGFRGSDARINFIVTADEQDTRRFLGPLTQEFLTFCDPDRDIVKAMDLKQIPAFVFIRVDGEIAASAEGWNPREWRVVADQISATTSWQSPTITASSGPGAFAGSAALG